MINVFQICKMSRQWKKECIAYLQQQDAIVNELIDRVIETDKSLDRKISEFRNMIDGHVDVENQPADKKIIKLKQ